MVKGVSKSIIEISETGSKVFSKVILCVSPEYVDDDKRLKSEADRMVQQLTLEEVGVPLRITVKKEHRRRLFLFIGAGVALSLATVMIALFL